MARLKFLLFALLVLGAWAAHLYVISPRLSARAVEQAEASVGTAPAVVVTHLQQRRLDLQRAALKLAATPEAAAALQPAKPGKIDAPTAEKLAAVKATLNDSVTPSLKKSIVVALSNEAGTIAARGDEPANDGAGIDLAKITQGGADGVGVDAFGQAHVFYALPVTSVEKGETKVVGNIVVGAPVLADDLIEAVAKETNAGAVGLIKDGKVVQAAGQQKAMLEKALATASGKSSIVERGVVEALGPLKLPVLTTEQDTLGGGAPLWVASRQPVQSGGFDVVTVASVGASMNALAEYQKLAVFSFGGIFGVSLLFLLVMGGGAKAPKEKPAKAEKSKDKGEKKDEAAPPTEQAQVVADGVSTVPPPLPDLPPPPEATPDDFPFGNAPAASPMDAAQPDAPPPPPAEDHFAAPAPSNFPAELPNEMPTRAGTVNAAALFAQNDGESTSVYPSGADPFELAARQQVGGEGDPDYNPDATRVATIPQELLRASAQASEAPAPVRMSAAVAPPPMQAVARAAPAASPADAEEAHFQDVFRDFVKTREQCGEPPDGLTYDKFAVKLRKNKEQLVAKYNCRTVRFQVYVKEGKAALKATPVKE